MSSPPCRLPPSNGWRQIGIDPVSQLDHPRVRSDRRAPRCGLPASGHGTRVRERNRIRLRAWLVPFEPKGQAEGSSIPEDQQRAAAPTSRCARIPRWADRAAHAIVRRPACDRAAVARLPTHQKPGREQAGLSRRLMALLPVKPGHDSDRKEPSGSHELCLRSRISALPARVAGCGTDGIERGSSAAAE